MLLVNRDISFSRYPLRAEPLQPELPLPDDTITYSDAYGCSAKEWCAK